MLLAVDIGNSRVKLGVFDGENLIQKISLPTPRVRKFSPDDLHEIAQPISRALICSVVPEINVSVAAAIEELYTIKPTIVCNDFDFGLTILHTPLETIGTDRLVNCFSAVERYGSACMVCSVGTALTIDFVDSTRTLRGGVIAPGMQMLAKSLHASTSQLPEVEIAAIESVLQQTTVAALQSGVVNGFLGLFETLIEKVREETKSTPQVIATGGAAGFVAKNVRGIDVVDENLLLDGLERLDSRINQA